MNALHWLLVGVMALELSALVALFGANCLLHARTGRPLDFARPRRAVIELPRSVKDVDVLWRDARRRTSLRLRVALSALDSGRTRMVVTTKPGLLYRFTQQRAAELDRLAVWLAHNHGGRVVATGFGNLR